MKKKKVEEPVYLMFDAKNKLYVAPLGHTTQAKYGRRFTDAEVKKFMKKHPGYERKPLGEEAK